MQIPLYQVHMPTHVGAALEDVLYSGRIAGGPRVEKFESALCGYLDNPRVTTTGDISSSLALCLMMAGVGPGDEVIVSPMACLATTAPIRNLFADVRWCDVDPRTGNLCPHHFQQRISPRTKAVVVYHWAGNPADLQAIQDVARSHDLAVVEDAGEALGGEYQGRKIGNTGSDYTVFSFHAIRHITTGEGAAVAFGSEAEYERGRWLKRYGIHQPTFRDAWGEISPDCDIPLAGYNTYMNQLAATIGLAQMAELPRLVERHQANGSFYDGALEGVDGLQRLKRLPDTRSACWVYTILVERRDDLLRRLREKGVYASRVHLRNDIYSCFAGPETVPLPGVDYFDAHCLSLPCGWWMNDEQRQYVADCIHEGW